MSVRSSELVDTEYPHHFESDGHALCTGGVMAALGMLGQLDARPVDDGRGNFTRRMVITHPLIPGKRYVVTVDPIEYDQ